MSPFINTTKQKTKMMAKKFNFQNLQQSQAFRIGIISCRYVSVYEIVTLNQPVHPAPKLTRATSSRPSNKRFSRGAPLEIGNEFQVKVSYTFNVRTEKDLPKMLNNPEKSNRVIHKGLIRCKLEEYENKLDLEFPVVTIVVF